MNRADTPLEMAVRIVGSQAELARRCGTSQPRIWQCLNRNRSVPADLVLPIERSTEGAVTRHQLRPDLYPLEDAATLDEKIPAIRHVDKPVDTSVDLYSLPSG